VQTLRGVVDKKWLMAFEGRFCAVKGPYPAGRENWDGVGLRDVDEQILEPFGLQDRRVARFAVEVTTFASAESRPLTFAMVFPSWRPMQRSTARSRRCRRADRHCLAN